MEEGPDDPLTQPCPHCHQNDFNYEDLDGGEKLVCRDCGYVLDEVVLVHQRALDDAGMPQPAAWVSETDDGRAAGASLIDICCMCCDKVGGVPRPVSCDRVGCGHSGVSCATWHRCTTDVLDG